MKNLLKNLMSMKNFRRWPRLLLAILYLFAIYRLILIVRHEYIDTHLSSATNNLSGGIAFGLSLVAEEPQTLLSSLDPNIRGTELSKSFLIQSQSPTIQVFADYISIYENAELPRYCFTAFLLNRDINVPAEVVSGIQKIPTSAENEDQTLGKLRSSGNQSVFNFEKPFCLNRGNKYFLPHLFLGIISSETSADLPLPGFMQVPTITGHRALEFFPFEQQKIVLNLNAHYTRENMLYKIRPNLDVSVSQQGWIGEFKAVDKDTTVLNLTRPYFYKVILIAFALIMPLLVIFLNNIIDEIGGFFEVAFGLLLGLWGTHEILIPEYIGSSVPIDVIIYILYALVIGEIIISVVDELIHAIAKRSIKIHSVAKVGLQNECVVLENRGLFPVDMTRWVLLDQAANKFKFPIFVLPGKLSLPVIDPSKKFFLRRKSRTVSVWTKLMPHPNDDNGAVPPIKHLRENLYWGRKKEVWDNDEDTAYLEDAKGNAIDTYSYPLRQEIEQQDVNAA